MKATWTKVRVSGADRLEEPYIVTANHPSFVDALALAPVLPGRPRFVVASEFGRRAMARVFLRRLGSELVTRHARAQSVADARRLLARIHDGESLVIFPEGSLCHMPGVRPFHLGAFLAASSAERPVVPIVINGTRTLLRPGSAFPRRADIELIIGEPLSARGTDWSAALQLAGEVRQVILEHCREPDLAIANGARSAANR